MIMFGQAAPGGRTSRKRASGETRVNVKAALSPDEVARACADAMWAEDDASKGLGMEIVEIAPGLPRSR